MSSLSRQQGGGAPLLQLGLEMGWLVAAVVLAVRYHSALSSLNVVAPALMFAVLMVGLNAAFGLYRRDGPVPFGEYVLRQSAALVIGLPIAYVSSQILPGGAVFQQAFVPVVLIALAGLLALRQIMVSPLARMLSPYRVLVLGTGPEALAVETSLEVANRPGLALAGFYPLEKVPIRSIAASRIVSNHLTLEETVKHLGIDEIIVAVREQRGGVLPMRALLECRLSGTQVTDLPRFFERVHGRVPIESLKASWLIYGMGFRQTWLRAFVKRSFDIIATVVLLLIALPIMLVIAFLISLDGGTPIIYRQERVGCRGQTFTLLKFRSMTKDAEKDGQASWASINDSRVTAVGRFIRRTRIDELPQLINVLRGEMSFVGPRPERPQFVATLTEKIPFYAVRHSVKPGLTGWAQVRYTYGGNIEESVKKLEYDLFYVKNHSLLLDVLILLKTVRVVLLGEGAR
ncbi:MAG TPA: TIGR03013 family XrtA/PEP-CTERM system glycosyltransferase [Casimicrobiaceae bacterium]|jgi:sugar transferase (PEP-CTERM system associated)|nr:TIGR03013 family XrtA/PEP-CTERM system glycosyltransferase [Casimicrobiaceae bacterium]